MNASRFFWIWVLVATAGCANRDPELASVEGRVTTGGQPLKNIEVVFAPELGTAGRDFSAYTDADGKYRITANPATKVGVPVGKHRVVVRDADMYLVAPGRGVDLESGEIRAPAVKSPPKKASRVPADYGDSAKTPLRDVSITAGVQTYDIPLDPAK